MARNTLAGTKTGKSKRNSNAGKHPSYKARGMSKESIRKKKAYDKAYNKKTVSDRVDRNRKRREGQKAGNPKAKKGSGYDYDHATKRYVKKSLNRGRTSKNGGTAGDKRARG